MQSVTERRTTPLVVLDEQSDGKSTAYALSCYEYILSKHSFDGVPKLIQWSDGPKQFKSSRFLASAISNLEKHPNLEQVDICYGFPKHFKGPWDGWFGCLKRIFEDHLATLEDGEQVKELSEVVEISQKWAAEYMEQHPDGPVLHVVEFMPPPKHTVHQRKLLTKSLLGTEFSYAFQFRRTDARRQSLLGRGGNKDTDTGV